MLEVVRRCSGGRPAPMPCESRAVVSSNTAAAADEGEWVSDHSDDDAGHDAALALMRIRARSDTRRHQPQQQQRRGVAKAARRGASGRAAQQRLAAAYARYQTDEPAIRRTVSEMGQGDADTILQMIRGGISVDVADAAGRTALHAACSCGNDAGVRQLLHMGAAPNARDRIGNTPLTLAATGVRADIVVLLLEAGADPRIGGALVLATAMVRARLQLLRASTRQARIAEAALDPDDAHTIRERRIQSAAVACECVDIIRLLRYRAMNPLHEPANPAYGALVTTRPGHDEDDSLDDLAAQLTAQLAALRLGARPLRDAPAPDQDRAPDSPPTAAARTSRGGDTEDDHMDVLLGRLSRLLGEDDDRDSA
ncbi:hypothetical protein H4R21_001694 [Coemansia helicoidea]|uniref:Uncharacterized protein n=1 Tax=Coemansia helicoidea TaxID=1286919 RepID=A0ACC1LAU4_9FUNG|nr:hypothetical protein H4R21_001694 [Coemansia helicoidea]